MLHLNTRLDGSNVGDERLLRWARQQLGVLVGALRRQRGRVCLAAVELSEESGLEVLWEVPGRMRPPEGWVVVDGGWAWRMPYSADGHTLLSAGPAAAPALVTVGWRGERRLLVDLEAIGLISVSASDTSLRWGASLAVELASGRVLGAAMVTTVGLDIEVDVDAVPSGRLRASDASSALAQLSQVAASPASARRTRRSWPSALGEPSAHLSHVMMLFDPNPQVIDSLGALARRRRGVAVVVVTDRAVDAHVHVEIDPAGSTARLEPLGIEFRPAARRPGPQSRSTSALRVEVKGGRAIAGSGRADVEIAAPFATAKGGVVAAGVSQRELVEMPGVPRWTVQWLVANRRLRELNRERLSTPPSVLLDTSPPPGVPRSADPSPEARPIAGERLIVRVLGVPRIDERPGLCRRELALVVLLACRGTSLAASSAQDALWGGRAVEAKTVWNLVSRVRRAMGMFPDGTPVMPAADRVRGRLRIDPRVTTDLALLRRGVTDAINESSVAAIRLLRDALALVEGPPFDAPGYDWAHRDQDVAEAAATIEQATDRLVDLAVEAGHLDVAREALTRGLRALPGDEHLYRIRMRVEAAAGNHVGIAAAYNELTVYLADLETRPSSVTTAEFHELIGRRRHAGSPG